MVFPEGFTEIDADPRLKDAYERYEGGYYDASFRMFSALSESGSLEGLFLLSFHYANGKGVVKDLRKAAKLLTECSDAGFLPAVSELAQCYAYGLGVDDDDERAFSLFSRAAESGDPYAMGMLSLMYHNGDGVRRNHKLADEWSDRCENSGDIGEIEEQGLTYAARGNGPLARMFLLRSAVMGSPVSAKALEIMYTFGLGVAEDDDEASDWGSTAEDTGWDEVTSEDLGDFSEWFGQYVTLND